MRKRGWIILLCMLLVAGAASDHYGGSWNSGARDRIAVTAPFNPQYTANQNPQSSVEQIATLCGITKFRNSYHTSGAGQKIALIDSGIDLSHEAFQPNADWTDKVVVYRDFTQEGYLYTQAVSCYGDKVAASGTIYHIGQIPNTVQQYRMSFLKLNEFQPELFPETEQQIAVLVTAEQGIYNCVYLDTNQNCDFSDEQPLHCYQEKPQHITLHNSGYNLNLALTSIAEDGTQIQLTADTLGHGTFLAGVMAGNGAVYQGLAPQAQLYVYKIFNRDGQSSQVLLAQAIQQAVLDGADSINLSLGKIEAVLGPNEQIPGETYEMFDRIKTYIVEVRKSAKGPQIVVSRTHPGLLKRLFELEVPEIQDGVVEIKSVAREAGSRSKLAVYSTDENVDCIGACIGAKGARVQAIVNELRGEKIDIVKWNEDPGIYIANALSPAGVIDVQINEEEKKARVIVPDYQLSLAIGKEGQNARLAAKLTGWKIDIKSETQAQEAGIAYEEQNYEEMEDYLED